MILAQVSFGRCPAGCDPGEMYDSAECYLNYLRQGLQLSDISPLIAWHDGELIACVALTYPGASHKRKHTKWGREALKALIDITGIEPGWNITDDYASKRNPSWRSADYLYLETHIGDTQSPICHNKRGEPIPGCLLPLDDMTRWDIYSWASTYKNHHNLFLASGVLETQAYHQLAKVDSELSRSGRDACRAIESATGKPTFYYLMRWWGRGDAEADRVCPGCGGQWKTQWIDKPSEFWQFDFKCNTCRLVSHTSTTTDKRRASIGEWRG